MIAADRTLEVLGRMAGEVADDHDAPLVVAGLEEDGVAGIRVAYADGSTIEETQTAVGSGTESALGQLEALDTDKPHPRPRKSPARSSRRSPTATQLPARKRTSGRSMARPSGDGQSIRTVFESRSGRVRRTVKGAFSRANTATYGIELYDCSLICLSVRSMSDTTTVLEHHLDAFAEQDLEEVMVDYTGDSVVVTNMGVFRGLDEIEGLFADLFDEFSQEGAAIEVDDTVVEDDFAYLLWHGETPDNVYEFCTDTFHILDGTIDYQSFAGQIEPKG